jgi:hypothetical protein
VKRIDANSRTIRELLDAAKFSIDSSQREYVWKGRQIQELIDELSGKFLGCYENDRPEHRGLSPAFRFLRPPRRGGICAGLQPA